MFNFEITISNPDNPSEKYIISPKDSYSVWIGKEDGEGGEFVTEALFKVIDKFYKKNY